MILPHTRRVFLKYIYDALFTCLKRSRVGVQNVLCRLAAFNCRELYYSKYLYEESSTCDNPEFGVSNIFLL